MHLGFYLGPQGYAAYHEVECLRRWCWSDAVFMGPPVWLALARHTGHAPYRDYALSEFWAITDFLYDRQERLYYRDSRSFQQRDTDGRKVFWSRGNAWVLAGIALTLNNMDVNDPGRPRLEAHFRELAGRIRDLQRADGYWESSLLAPATSNAESSGTALFTYGLAWGVSRGLLNRTEYEPAIRRGWAALIRSIQPDGRLGWVQQVGDAPETVAASDTQYYGTGAFLLAATAVADLDGSSAGQTRR